MSDQTPTLPTFETVLTEMREFRSFVEHMLAQMDIRMDRLESHALQTRSEVIGLRADFKSSVSTSKNLLHLPS